MLKVTTHIIIGLFLLVSNAAMQGVCAPIDPGTKSAWITYNDYKSCVARRSSDWNGQCNTKCPDSLSKQLAAIKPIVDNALTVANKAKTAPTIANVAAATAAVQNAKLAVNNFQALISNIFLSSAATRNEATSLYLNPLATTLASAQTAYNAAINSATYKNAMQCLNCHNACTTQTCRSTCDATSACKAVYGTPTGSSSQG